MRTQNGVVPAACLQVYEWRVQLKVSSHKKLSLDACTVTAHRLYDIDVLFPISLVIHVLIPCLRHMQTLIIRSPNSVKLQWYLPITKGPNMFSMTMFPYIVSAILSICFTITGAKNIVRCTADFVKSRSDCEQFSTHE